MQISYWKKKKRNTLSKSFRNFKSSAEMVDGFGTNSQPILWNIFEHYSRELNYVICRIDHLVNESLYVGHSRRSPCHSMLDAMIRSASPSLNTNKRDETYGISSDHFKKGTCSLFWLLSGLSVQCYFMALATLFNESVIEPILKMLWNPQLSLLSTVQYH